MDNCFKERSSNFSAAEIEKLKMLIGRHKDALMCKKTDAISHHRKELAWKYIHRSFNSDAVTHRSIKQLKYKFDNLKKTARRDARKERQERRRTGGSPELPTVAPTTGDWVRSILHKIMSPDDVETTYDTDVIESTPKEPTPIENSDSIIHAQTLQNTTDAEYTTQTEIEILHLTDLKQEKNNISEDTNELPVFNGGGPASLPRCPVSAPLKGPRESAAVTPQALRQSIKDLSQTRINLNNSKQNIMNGANAREYQEHQLRLKHMEEMHVQALRHNEERHAAEVRILKLKAQLLEKTIENFNK